MTVFVEPLGDIAGLADGREVVFETGVVRENHAGTGMVTPRRVSVLPVNGVLTTPSLDPGPARVCIAFEWFDITIPDGSGPQRLWPLIEDSVPYEPPVVSLVKEYRDEMVSTKAAVETSLEHYGGVLTGLAERAERAADRAEEAEGGVPSGGWPLSSLAQEVIDSFGGGVSLPIGLADLSVGVKASLAKADSAVQGDDARLTNARTPTAHQHTIAGVEYLSDALDSKAPKNNPTFTGTVTTPGLKVTTGAGTGKVFTSDSDGVGTWQALTTGGVAVGPTSVAATAEGSKGTAVGSAASAGGTAALAMGSISDASGNYAMAIGSGSTASHSTSVAIGYASATTKSSQIMLGSSNRTVTIPGKMELGSGSAEATISTRVESGVSQVVAQFPGGDPMVLAPASGGGGIAWAVSNTSALSNATPTVSSSTGGGMAIGYSAVSGGFDRDIALGPRAQTSGQGSIAMGDNARATGNQSLSVGRAAWASHGASSAFGAGATTTKTNQVMLGTSAQTVTMPGKAEIGEGSTMVTLSTRLTGGKAELIATLPSGKIISLGIDT